jgi:hypothetical protein
MTDTDTTHQDAVMSWLQERELKDHKLGIARSSRARAVDINTAIGRLQEQAYADFPHVDHASLDVFVRAYVDPHKRVPVRSGE